ncbi:MAG TPA: carboxymuconolactone decarboxylase family protein [Bryobacteraceae bacterium]|jgi:alkylhydroperoxidase AhpD family core domain|nr:carboxymuconolactone decarboxylase family protein [Bryobacteraceae bacterium]
MEQSLYPAPSKDLVQKRKELAPEAFAAFQAFSQTVFADGALPSKTKELIAVAVAHVTQCPYCIRSHTKRATLKGATGQEIMEAIWVASEMRAGAAAAHSALAIDVMNQEVAKPK